MRLLLAVAVGFAGIEPSQVNGSAEYGVIVFVSTGVHKRIFDGDVVLLCPFYQSGLEVLLGLDEVIEVEVFLNQAVDDESAATFIALVEIYGTNDCLEGIAAHVAVVCRGV